MSVLDFSKDFGYSQSNAADEFYRMMTMPDNAYSPGTASDFGFWASPEQYKSGMSILDAQKRAKMENASKQEIARANLASEYDRAIMTLQTKLAEMQAAREERGMTRDLKREEMDKDLTKTRYTQTEANKRAKMAADKTVEAAQIGADARRSVADTYAEQRDDNLKINDTLLADADKYARQSLPGVKDPRLLAEEKAKYIQLMTRKSGSSAAPKAPSASPQMNLKPPQDDFILPTDGAEAIQGMFNRLQLMDSWDEPAGVGEETQKFGAPQVARNMRGPDLRTSRASLPEEEVQYNPGGQTFAGTGNYGDSGIRPAFIKDPKWATGSAVRDRLKEMEAGDAEKEAARFQYPASPESQAPKIPTPAETSAQNLKENLGPPMTKFADLLAGNQSMTAPSPLTTGMNPLRLLTQLFSQTPAFDERMKALKGSRIYEDMPPRGAWETKPRPGTWQWE